MPVKVQDIFEKPLSRIAAPLPLTYFESVSIAADATHNESILRRSAEMSFEKKLNGFSMANIIKNKQKQVVGSYTQTADQDSREDLSDDDMPFQKKSSKIRIVNHAQLPVQEPA